MGVTLSSGSGTFTSGYTFASKEAAREVFFADQDYGVYLDGSSNAELAIERTLTFQAGAHGVGDTYTVVCRDSTDFTLPACAFEAEAGYAFTGWKFKNYQGAEVTAQPGDTTFVTFIYNTTPSDAYIFTAQWRQLYAVSFAPGTSASGSMATVYVEPDTWYTLPASTFTPPEGKMFVGWQASSDGRVYSAGSIAMIDEPMTFTAIWASDVYIPASGTMEVDLSGAGAGTSFHVYDGVEKWVR